MRESVRVCRAPRVWGVVRVQVHRWDHQRRLRPGLFPTLRSVYDRRVATPSIKGITTRTTSRCTCATTLTIKRVLTCRKVFSHCTLHRTTWTGCHTIDLYSGVACITRKVLMRPVEWSRYILGRIPPTRHHCMKKQKTRKDKKTVLTSIYGTCPVGFSHEFRGKNHPLRQSQSVHQ